MGGEYRLLYDVLDTTIDNRGKTPPTSPVGYPLIEVKHIHDDRNYPVFSDTKYVDQTTWDSWFRGHLKPRDILFSTVGSIARSCIVPESPTFCIAQNVLGFRVDHSKADFRFVYYAINDRFFQHEVHGRTIETVQKSIKVHDLKTCRIPCPPLPEQKAIASILGALDDKIELNRRMNETLESMARAIFKSWFVDFDPVRAKMDGQQPAGMNPETAALFPDSFEEQDGEMVPKGWALTTLGEVIEIFDSKRIPLSGREREQRQGTYPYHGAASVMDYVDDYLFDGIYILMGEDGSVVNKDGSPVLQYVWGKFWVNNHAHVLRGTNGVSAEHLLLHLQGSTITPYVTGAVQPKLNQRNMKQIDFVLASPQVCEAFAEEIQPMFARVRSNSEESQTLANLRDTLLPKLLSGELRVPEAEKQVEEVA
jgi:type I restriction enzyme, S subunit